MLMFTFTANPAIAFKVELPTLRVIASTEQEAREIADAEFPNVVNDATRPKSVETNIVGVSAKQGVVSVRWDHPYLHPHLTLCSKTEVTAGIVRYQTDQLGTLCSHCQEAID